LLKHASRWCESLKNRKKKKRKKETKCAQASSLGNLEKWGVTGIWLERELDLFCRRHKNMQDARDAWTRGCCTLCVCTWSTEKGNTEK
jgi:hypothetical protein